VCAGFGVGIIPLTFMSMKYGTRFILGGMTLAWGERQQQRKWQQQQQQQHWGDTGLR
jgi:hypothetical protein